MVHSDVTMYLQSIIIYIDQVGPMVEANGKLQIDCDYRGKVDLRTESLILQEFAPDLYQITYTFCKMFWLPGVNRDVQISSLQNLFDILGEKIKRNFGVPKMQSPLTAVPAPDLDQGRGNVIYFAILDLLRVSFYIFYLHCYSSKPKIYAIFIFTIFTIVFLGVQNCRGKTTELGYCN